AWNWPFRWVARTAPPGLSMTPPGLKPCTAAPPGRTVVVDGWCAEAADAVPAASPSSEPAAMTSVARGMLQRLNIGLLRLVVPWDAGLKNSPNSSGVRAKYIFNPAE